MSKTEITDKFLGEFESKDSLRTMKASFVKSFLNKVKNESTTEDIWISISNIVSAHPNYKKIAFIFIIDLLKHNLYTGSYLHSLTRLLPDLLFDYDYLTSSHVVVKDLFCGSEIKNLYAVFNGKTQEDKHLIFFHIEFNSEFLTKLLCEFINYIPEVTSERDINLFIDSFEKSLDGTTCSTITDFGEYSLWRQVNYYKTNFSKYSLAYKNNIFWLVRFYRFLAQCYPQHDFWTNAHTISWRLLFSNRLVTAIKDDFFFTVYNINTPVEMHDHYVFILKGFNAKYTRIKKDDFVSVSLDFVQSSFYKKALLQYLLSEPTHIIHVNMYICRLRKGLKIIEHCKSSAQYPNPDLTYFTSEEAVLLRDGIYNKSLSLSSNNNNIGALRRFLLWAQSNHIITTDTTFFNYLTQYEEPSKQTAHAIPDDDLAKLSRLMAQNAKDNYNAKLFYAIFHIALETEFRLSQILHLTIDSIKPTMKPNQFCIHSNSKTSHGRIDKYVITDLTYRHIIDIIEETGKLRAQAEESVAQYIFLLLGRSRSVTVLNIETFRAYMKNCCDELNIPRYTSQNIRDTHMTKAFEYILRNGKSDLEMKILSKHRNLDTTKSHYIELELEKMLEATYGIIIGDKNLIAPDKNVVLEIPSEVNTEDSVVEHGCGSCTCKRCVVSSSLPCLACEYFVTTIAHEKYFVKAIENIDKLIDKANTKHDIDDLTTIKTLYVLYLQAIYRKKAAESDSL